MSSTNVEEVSAMGNGASNVTLTKQKKTGKKGYWEYRTDAEQHRRLGNYELSHDSAELAYNSESIGSMKLGAMLEMAITYEYTGDYERANRVYSEYLKSFDKYSKEEAVKYPKHRYYSAKIERLNRWIADNQIPANDIAIVLPSVISRLPFISKYHDLTLDTLEESMSKFWLAKRYFERGMIDEALVELLLFTYRPMGVTEPNPHTLTAYCYLYKKEWDKAAEQFLFAWKNGKYDKRPEDVISMGEYYVELGQPQKRIKLYSDAIELRYSQLIDDELKKLDQSASTALKAKRESKPICVTCP